MADYPTLIQAYGSTQKDDGGFAASRTVSGTLKLRSFYTSDVRQFTIIHDLDDTDKGTLKTFYDTNRKLIFNFTWDADSQVYTCRFLRAIQFEPTQGNRWTASVLMEVV